MLMIALTRAITETVPAAMQQEIFSKALYEHLFYKDRDGNTPLSDAFKRALGESTRELAKQVIEEPANKAAIARAIQEALDNALADGRFMKRVADKMIGSLGYI